MRRLKKATQETLTEAAQQLQLISQQAVSRKFTGKSRKPTKKQLAAMNAKKTAKADNQKTG
jgi:hypothetical protein